MSAIYPTPAHSDLADGRKGEHATFAHPRERTRDPLIDHPRPAPPSCCHLPLLPHRCCHTALATWARFGCLYADDATLLLPRHCYHTAMLILPRRRYRAADAALLPLPHCRCGHTAAATLRMLHCILLANATPAAAVPADDTPTAATTPAASMPAAATPAATPTTTATPAPASRTRATLHSATPKTRDEARNPESGWSEPRSWKLVYSRIWAAPRPQLNGTVCPAPPGAFEPIPLHSFFLGRTCSMHLFSSLICMHSSHLPRGSDTVF